jgi:DNA adenine methylase
LKTITNRLAAPFPWFGGKSLACEKVWGAFGEVKNYVEPFAGSAAMLLGAPDGNRVETINDFDGFVANFWRAVAQDAQAVAAHADWPCNEVDLFSRHGWLVRERETLTQRLHADPDWFDAKIAGWWVWGLCNWIASGWCSGDGPWEIGDDGIYAKKDNAVQGIIRRLPRLSSGGQGISRRLPHLASGGRGINRETGSTPRKDFICEWFALLQNRMRDVRVTCGDWQRVLKDSVTTGHGLTGVFLDPPYEKGKMDYAAGGMGLGIAKNVQEWCAANGENPLLRIVICGHAGEHDALLLHGWQTRKWEARKGYAVSEEAVANSKSETLWCSPHCEPERGVNFELFL